MIYDAFLLSLTEQSLLFECYTRPGYLTGDTVSTSDKLNQYPRLLLWISVITEINPLSNLTPVFALILTNKDTYLHSCFEHGEKTIKSKSPAPISCSTTAQPSSIKMIHKMKESQVYLILDHLYLSSHLWFSICVPRAR